MNEQVWSELGIAPTQDLQAIRKAYALRLRVTRPDDDAQAYQRLRAAYEWAQQWARRSRAPLEADEAEYEPEVFEQPAAAEAAEVADAEVATVVDRQDLLGWIERLRTSMSSQAAWDEIRPQLFALPLHLQAEASVRFADLVIGAPQLPVSVVEALETHFAWRDDFRVAQQLGVQRAHALHDVLELRVARAISDPEKLQHFAPLLHLQHLRRQSRDMAAFWFAMRMGDPLLQLLLRPEVRKGRPLVAGQDAPISSGWLVYWAGVARVVPLVLLLLLALKPEFVPVFWQEVGPTVPGDHPMLIILKLLFVGAAPVILALGALLVPFTIFILATIVRIFAWQALHTRQLLPESWARWRAHPRLAWFGLAMLAGMAVALSCGGFSGDAHGSAVALVIVGALLAWPREASHGAVALGTMFVMNLVIHRLAMPTGAQALNVLLNWVPLWVLGGYRVYLLGPNARGAAVFFRPVTNSLHLADRFGYKLALAPALIASAVAVCVDHVGAGAIFLSWVFSILGLAWLQNRLMTAAIREMG
jgi:hypothetical protein